MAPKFIICSNGNFRIGFVDQHKDLLQPGDQCVGGGYWEIDPVGMRLILTGHSYDFGEPKWNYLQYDGTDLRVPKDYQGLRIIYIPDERGEADFIVNQELHIIYI